VLVVDDADDARMLYAEYLERRGFKALVASGAETAKAMALARHPDVIVMDYSLAGSNGLTVTRELKREARTADIPVIILTGHVALAAVTPATVREAGASTLAIKPCLPDVIETEIRQLIAGRAEFRYVA